MPVTAINEPSPPVVINPSAPISNSLSWKCRQSSEDGGSRNSMGSPFPSSVYSSAYGKGGMVRTTPVAKPGKVGKPNWSRDKSRLKRISHPSRCNVEQIAAPG
jgi:hypothetical protein